MRKPAGPAVERVCPGRYRVRLGERSLMVERMGAHSPNRGLWETRDRCGWIIGVDARKRDALRCIEDGLY